MNEECPECFGIGMIIDELDIDSTCPTCDGTGYICDYADFDLSDDDDLL